MGCKSVVIATISADLKARTPNPIVHFVSRNASLQHVCQDWNLTFLNLAKPPDSDLCIAALQNCFAAMAVHVHIWTGSVSRTWLGILQKYIVMCSISCIGYIWKVFPRVAAFTFPRPLTFVHGSSCPRMHWCFFTSMFLQPLWQSRPLSTWKQRLPAVSLFTIQDCELCFCSIRLAC